MGCWDLVVCEYPQVVLVLKAWRGHGERLRLATVRGLEKPLVNMEGVSVEAEDPGLKESWRELETWHQVGVLESPKKAQEWWLLKMQPNGSTDPSILEIPWDKCQEQ